MGMMTQGNKTNEGRVVKQGRWIFPVFLPNLGCPHRCAFCDQHAVTGEGTGFPDLQTLDALFKKVRFSKRNRDNPDLLRQIAFYGGNFSGLARERQRLYLNWATGKVVQGWVHSIRFSTRPDALDENEISFLKGYPVRTVEIGVQSLDDQVLKGVQRGHTTEACKKAVEKVVSAGWEAGVQLMPGLPGETLKGFLEGVDTAAGWGIHYARLYPAVVLRGTKLAVAYTSGSYKPLTLEEAIEWCARACEIFEAKGVEVIRMGLPASDALKGSVVAGPYHPAFGFLVQSFRFHKRIQLMIREKALDSGPIQVHLSPSDLPLLMGDRRKAWKALQTSCGGREITYCIEPAFQKGSVGLGTIL